MKKIIIGCFYLLLSSTCLAQINVSPVKVVGASSGDMENIEPIEYNKVLGFLKKENTYFIVPKNLEKDTSFEQLKAKLASNWKLGNNILFVTEGEFRQLPKKRYMSVISLTGRMYLGLNLGTYHSPYKYSNKGSVPLMSPHNLQYWMINNSNSYYKLASIRFVPFFSPFLSKYKKYKRELLTKAFTNTTTFYGNWFSSYINNSINLVQNRLNSKTGTHEIKCLNNSLTDLKKDTLYIPEYLLQYKTKVKVKLGNAKDLITDYRYPVRVLDKKELNQIIENAKIPIYYLIGAVGGTTQCISVLNSQTSTIVYQKCIGNSAKLKSKHLEDIENSIDNSK